MTRAADLAKLIAGGGTITVADNSTNITLKSTDDDANGGPIFDLTRDSASPADNDAMGSIRFRSDDDGGNETQFVDVTGYAPDVSNGSEDGQLQIRTIVGGTLRNRLDLASGETVFNEDSVDLDFRVESNTLTHGLFVEGATGNVMIGTSVAGRSQEGAERLTIADTGHSGMTIRSGTENYGIIHFSDSEGGAGEYAGQIYYGHGGLGENLVFATQGSNRVKVTADVEIVDGNLKVASGHGVDFSATSDGTTMGSELFDDYEEGTFTASFNGSTSNPTVSYSAQLGTYVKIGKLVYVNVSVIAVGTPSGGGGNLRISGLPFTSKSGVQQAGTVAFTNTLTTTSGTTQMSCNIEGNDSVIHINEHEYSGTSSMSRMQVSGIHNYGPRIVCSITYETS